MAYSDMINYANWVFVTIHADEFKFEGSAMVYIRMNDEMWGPGRMVRGKVEYEL